MDDDLRHGRVYFSHLEGKPRAAAALAGFKSANGFIKREIGRALNLRRTPELEFEFDPGIEHAARIGALLREMQRHRANDPSAAGRDLPQEMSNMLTTVGLPTTKDFLHRFPES